MNELPPWKQLDNFSKSAHQRAIDAINALVRKPDSAVHKPGADDFQARIGQPVLVRITGPATAGGRYNGIIRFPTGADILPGTINPWDYGIDSDAAGISVTDSGACIFINLLEKGQTTHDLTQTPGGPDIFPGIVWQRNEADGLWVVQGIGINWRNC